MTFLLQGSVLLLDWMTRLCKTWDFKQVGTWILFYFICFVLFSSRNQHISTWNRHLGCSGGWALWSTGAEMAENLPQWNSVLKNTLSPTNCKSVWTDSSNLNHSNIFSWDFFFFLLSSSDSCRLEQPALAQTNDKLLLQHLLQFPALVACEWIFFFLINSPHVSVWNSHH